MASSKRSVEFFQTSEGAKIFQIPLNAFPGFWDYAYLVLIDDYKVLIDTGSNWGTSNQGLEEGFESISESIEEQINLADPSHIFITHGHIDHFGGLAYIRQHSTAQIGVHELDRRILSNYEERLLVAAQRLMEFLRESGVPAEERNQIYDYYMFPKSLFSSVDVDFTYQAVDMQVGPFRFLHTPGHGAGAVVIRLHDILFSGDHILSGISPHQAPERLTLNTGLSHYLESLEKVKTWASDVKLVLGGHKNPLTDLGKRVDEIRALHFHRLEEILQLLETPNTVSEISKNLFGKAEGYNTLLAIEESGAHVEYLYQYGYLSIYNLEELNQESRPAVIKYCRVNDALEMLKTLEKKGEKGYVLI